MKKLPYREGDIFVVPLHNQKFALGVIARMAPAGKALLGYFFDYFPAVIPAADTLPALRPQDAIKVVHFGDLSLYRKEWPVMGRIDNWSRQDWPMPKFVRHDPLSNRNWLVTYSEDNPNVKVAEEPCLSGAEQYEPDSLWGAGFTEIMLTKICNEVSVN